MNGADLFLYVSSINNSIDAREELKNKNKKHSCCCCCNQKQDNRHPLIIKQEQEFAQRQKDIFNSIYGGISQPLNYNQKVFELAKEHKKEELKEKIYNVPYIVDNVYSKAQSAIEDKFIIHKDMFSLAKDIEYFKTTMVDERKLISEIILEADLDDNLSIIKPDYLMYKRV